MSHSLLFYRDFQRYSGGHGKVWDYFRHAGSAPGWEPRIHQTARSVPAQNPWRIHDLPVLQKWEPAAADALFLGGVDWEAYPHDDHVRPVINLVQHVRHGDAKDPRYRFLKRPAVRICVSEAVARAIAPAEPLGPVIVIEAGISVPPPPRNAVRTGIFIDAIKQPQLGAALAARLRDAGRHVHLNSLRIPPARYLELLAGCRIAVVLPRPTEGFYLPGLEAMAQGCATVVPDCVGNRAYLKPEQNALAPPLELEALIQAVTRLDEPGLCHRLASGGIATAARFSLEREREAFHDVLRQLPDLWRLALEKCRLMAR